MTWYEMIPFVSISILDPSFSPFLFSFLFVFPSPFFLSIYVGFFFRRRKEISLYILYGREKKLSVISGNLKR